MRKKLVRGEGRTVGTLRTSSACCFALISAQISLRAAQMIPSARYVLAFTVNVALPMLAYRLALPRWGLEGALIASALPLLAWIGFDFVRLRHFDALSAIVLAGLAMSLLLLASPAGLWLRETREPLIGGLIGVLFLLSLALDRPLVFYLARSTLARERQGREREFDEMWQTRPALVKSIRLMTAVWGLGLVTENAIRAWMVGAMIDSPGRDDALVRYGVYGALTIWTILYRHAYLKRQT
ncbi:VC0807 family protein [Paraburkholderia bannensis]|uniref:VC0807 family protein n=1 Tax=Paraburkholderia bannensis TaxID=765414 RepID=UPI002AC33646|nr:VC0807 family protein [Paraburkholderia bannensis]